MPVPTISEMFGLSGRRTVVTGAGRGIGRAIAEALAGAGAEVLVHYNTSEAAAGEVVAGIQAAGGKAWAAQADVTDPAQVNALFEQVARRWGALDILVNNSGGLIRRTKTEEMSDEELDQTLRLNINGTICPIRAAIPLLRKGASPCIVNVSSVAAHNGGGNGAVIYASAKGAILTFTRGLAKELAPEIRVNGLAPGVIYTDFHRVHTPEDALKAMAASTPLRRLGTAEDNAAAVVFLCSPGASFVTGETIEVNGGLWVA